MRSFEWLHFLALLALYSHAFNQPRHTTLWRNPATLTRWTNTGGALRRDIYLMASTDSPVAKDKAVTYIPVELKVPKVKARNTILVKSGEEDIISIINSWEQKDQVEESLVEVWSQEGRAFWLTPQGTRSMHIAERKSNDVADQSSSAVASVDTLKYSSNMYVQIGDDIEPVYVKSSKIPKLKGIKQKTSTLKEMVRRGEAFTNVTKLMNEETMLNRIDSIANTLQSNFSMTSPEWKRWIDKTSVYNATNLQQVFAEYYREHSIGDVGSAEGDYVPKRGFPGTLAPGEKFSDNYPIEKLPKRILHPWPAMQQFQWHVRWPTSHPLIVPPLLWIGMNEMYTNNFTKWQYDSIDPSRDEIVGGTMMNPKDAIHIARNHERGNAYEPADQLKHGGNLFSGGHNIPHYTPDHGPTVSAEEAEPEIPEELLPITTRWLDPFFGMDIPIAKESADGGLLEEVEEEEEIRRKAAMKYLDAIEEEEEVIEEKTKLQKNLEKIIAKRTDAILPPPAEIIVESISGSVDSLKETQSRLGREEELAKELVDTVAGRARSKKALINYSIATVRDLKTETERVEKLSMTAKSRNRKKKRAVEKDDDDE